MTKEFTISIHRVAFIGSYEPRQCGIATFTSNLAEAIAAGYPQITNFALAITDDENGYAYSPRVRFEFEEKDIASYHRAADFINVNQVDVISLQHEFGIYGGPAGSYILTLLREINVPVVTTLHTILDEPDDAQFKVIKELAGLSNRLISMSRRGVEYLKNIYGVPEEMIDFIPHGIPDIPFVDPNYYKDRFGVEGKIVLLTFGLLSRNKGIEYVIKALPEILKHNPNIVYIILGATHPNVLRQEGESYRNYLMNLAHSLDVSRHVIFNNKFVSQEELVEYIGAADIYITPYLNPQQITSGTLAYTVGAGKAVISTPYWHAQEILAEDRGILVPFEDEKAIAREVINLLENEAIRHAIRKKAYLLGRDMVWPRVAELYMESFERSRRQPLSRPQSILVGGKIEDRESESLPPLNLYHLSRLTDQTGILQHAIYNLPNYYEGYTTDDNARALLVSILLERLGDDWFTGAEEFGARYLSFLWFAFNKDNFRFRNFLSYDRRWLEEYGSEDSHGRAMHSLGAVIGCSKHEELYSVAGMLFNQGLKRLLDMTSPRGWAFSIMGIYEYLQRFSGDREARMIMKELGQRLLDLYISTNSPDWHWFESRVTYSNGTLPEALLRCGHWLDRKDMIEIGLESLFWLLMVQTSPGGTFSPIGSKGFYERGGKKAQFDQQPIEAYSMVSACLSAYSVTGDERWRKNALNCFAWFLGENDVGIPLYDPETGGCRDGLLIDRANQNEGAESSLSFYLSLLDLQLAEKAKGISTHKTSPITLVPVRTPINTK